MAVGMGIAQAKASRMRSQRAAAIGKSIATTKKAAKKRATKKAAKKRAPKKAAKKRAPKKVAKKRATKRRRKTVDVMQPKHAKPKRKRKAFTTKVQVGRLKGRAKCPAGTQLITTGVARKDRSGRKHVHAWGRCIAI